MNDYLYPAYFVLVLFAAAFNSKALGLSIVTAISLMAFYPNPDYGNFVVLFFVPAYIVASFRE